MAANTTHTIKIQIWINGILELMEVKQTFETYIAARIYAAEYASKTHHPAYKLKVYNYLGEVVYSNEEVATPEIVTYA